MFKPGRKITSIAVLVKELQTTKWIYWGRGPKHCGWLWSQHLRTLMGLMEQGRLRKAVRL